MSFTPFYLTRWFSCKYYEYPSYSFAFAETISTDEIRKAVSAMDSMEINGRRLRVRAAGDKDKPNPRGSNSSNPA